MPDNPSQADDEPVASSAGQSWLSESEPTLEQDLSVLAWLETDREQLSSACTDYLCAALLEWSMLGELWPDPSEPVTGPDGDHLGALVQITERLVRHALDVHPTARRLGLARVGRELGTAIRCQRDPQDVAESGWRELVHRQPWLGGPPLPVVWPDGRVL